MLSADAAPQLLPPKTSAKVSLVFMNSLCCFKGTKRSVSAILVLLFLFFAKLLFFFLI